jgi:hypothetical protein
MLSEKTTKKTTEKTSKKTSCGPVFLYLLMIEGESLEVTLKQRKMPWLGQRRQEDCEGIAYPMEFVEMFAPRLYNSLLIPTLPTH